MTDRTHELMLVFSFDTENERREACHALMDVINAGPLSDRLMFAGNPPEGWEDLADD